MRKKKVTTARGLGVQPLFLMTCQRKTLFGAVAPCFLKRSKKNMATNHPGSLKTVRIAIISRQREDFLNFFFRSLYNFKKPGLRPNILIYREKVLYKGNIKGKMTLFFSDFWKKISEFFRACLTEICEILCFMLVIESSGDTFVAI